MKHYANLNCTYTFEFSSGNKTPSTNSGLMLGHMVGLFFISLFFLFPKRCEAQAPTIEWQKCYGGSFVEKANSIAEDYDGYILAGMTTSDDIFVSGHHGIGCGTVNCADFWLVKIDFTGNLIWQMCYGGSEQDEAFCVIPTNDSGYFACGVTWSFDGDVTGNHFGSCDFWIMKTNHLGTLQWQKCYGGNSPEIATSAIQTADGGYAICGSAHSNDGDVFGHHEDSTVEDMWVIKIDSIGNLQWQKCLGGTGGEDERARSIIQGGDGGYSVFGTASSYWGVGDVVGIHGNRPDYWLVKLDSLGNIINQNCYGGYIDYQKGKSMESTFDKGYILAGITSYDTGMVSGYHGNSTNLTGDAWIVKVDSTGNIKNQNCFGGTNEDKVFSIKQTIEGGYVFTGSTQSNDGDISGNHGGPDIYVIKLDTSFNLQWQKCLGGSLPEESFGILQTSDSGFVIVGYTTSYDGDVTSNHGIGDLWIIKLSSDPLKVPFPSNEIDNLNAFVDTKNGKIKIDFYSRNIMSINFELFDITGNRLLNRSLKAVSGHNSCELSIGNLSKGLYLFSLIAKNDLIVKKLILN